jgi:hypothetical protein
MSMGWLPCCRADPPRDVGNPGGIAGPDLTAQERVIDVNRPYQGTLDAPAPSMTTVCTID